MCDRASTHTCARCGDKTSLSQQLVFAIHMCVHVPARVAYPCARVAIAYPRKILNLRYSILIKSERFLRIEIILKAEIEI